MSSAGWPDPTAGDQTLAATQHSRQLRYFAGGIVFLAVTALAWPILGRGVRSQPFMPHVTCYLGNSTLISVNLISDLLIGISYVVISLTLVYLVRASKGGIPFHWMFLAFGTFIIACGGTHFMEAITLWTPVYWISAYVKVVTAVASLATAIALPLAMPNVLKNIQSWRLSEARAVELAQANRELSAANEKRQELDRLRRRFVAQTSANIGDWEWDLRTGKVIWSPEVEDMHGFARGSFPGTFDEWLNTVHPEDRDRAKAAPLDAIARGPSGESRTKGDYDIEYRSVRPDGTWYWLAGRGAIEYDGAGQPLRMLGMCMDISSRKLTEEALRKTEKLATAGRLAATIAHEINNPLEAVTNLIYLAQLQDPPPACAQMLEMADRELQRIGHITRQTLGFYRESSSPVQVELSEVLRGVIAILRGKLESRQITAHLEADHPVYACGVAGELRQVFANLLTNAVDASPAGAQIRIRIKPAGDQAQVTIADAGSGIHESAQAQIFEPFFTTKKDVGTGLGLWVTKQIIEKHGGRIRFRSRTAEGKSGTVFVVHLSRQESAPSTAAKTALAVP